MVMNQWSNVFYFQYHNIIGLDKVYDELHEMVVLKTEQKIINKNRIGQFKKFGKDVQDLWDRQKGKDPVSNNLRSWSKTNLVSQ